MEKMLITAMKASISEVMETMFFMPVEFVDVPEQSRIELLKSGPNKSCRLDFSGDCAGSITLMIPQPLLIEMTENFTGESKDTFGEEFLDGTLTETVNMICGNTLRKVVAQKPFELGIPDLIDGKQFPDSKGSMIIETPEAEMAIHITVT